MRRGRTRPDGPLSFLSRRSRRTSFKEIIEALPAGDTVVSGDDLKQQWPEGVEIYRLLRDSGAPLLLVTIVGADGRSIMLTLSGDANPSLTLSVRKSS